MSILHSRITGTGEPADRAAVLLGALGSSVDMWTPLQDALSGGPGGDPFRLIALDHRGHGASPMPGRSDGNPSAEDATTVADLAGDVLDTLDSLATGPVDLVGLSIGGAVAQHIAATSPDRVRTLTLMCTAPAFGDPSDWTTRATSVRARGIETLRELAESTMLRWFTEDFRTRRPATTLSVAEMITRTSPGGYAACCDALSTFDGRGLLEKITAPTLTVAGTWDRTAPPATLEAMNGVVRTTGTVTRHAEFPGAHLLPVERTAEVAEVLREHWAA